MVTITKEWLESGMYKGVGIKRTQCDVLGLKYPLTSGWKDTLVGKEISEKQAEEFLTLGRTSRKGLKKQKEVKPKLKHEKHDMNTVGLTNSPYNPNISFDDMEFVKMI